MNDMVFILLGLVCLMVLSVFVVLLVGKTTGIPVSFLKVFLMRFWATIISCLVVVAVYLGALEIIFPKALNSPYGGIISALSGAGLVVFCLIKWFQPYFADMIIE